MKKIALFLLLFFIVFISGCKDIANLDNSSYELNYDQYEVQTGDIDVGDQYIGYVEPFQQTFLSAKAGGRLTSIYVYKGDLLKSGDLVAKLDATEIAVDYNTSENILGATQLLYNNTSVMFDSQIKVMEERIAQAKQGMELVKQNLEGVETGLTDTQSISTQQLTSAQKQIEQSELSLKTAQTELLNTIEVLKQQENNIYSNASNSLSQTKILADSVLNFVDEILGVSDNNVHKNDDIESSLSAKNTGLKTEANTSWRGLNDEYQTWKNDLEKIIFSINASEDISQDVELKTQVYEILELTEDGLLRLNKLMADMYIIMDNSITNQNLTQERLNGIKQQILQYQKNIEGLILTAQGSYLIGVKGSIQSINNFQKESNLKTDMINDNIKVLEKQVETAKQNYGQYQAMTSGDINQVKNQKSVANKQYEISQKQHDEALASLEALKSQKQSQLSQIEAQMSAIRGNKTMASVQLGNTKVNAPFNGVVVEKLASVGQVVGIGTPIVSFADIKILKVKIYVAESDVSGLTIGDKASLYIKSLNKIYMGEIYNISPMAEINSKRIVVEIKFDNSQEEIKLGMSVNVELGAEKLSGKLISRKFVKYDLGDAYVDVLISGKTKKQNIDIIHCNNSQCLIGSGLNLGDLIIRN